jgi:hypothetical protein
MKGICKKRLGLRIERIGQNGRSPNWSVSATISIDRSICHDLSQNARIAFKDRRHWQ